MQRKQWLVMLGLVGWALIAGGRDAGAAPTRLVDVVPDVDANVTLTAPPAVSFDISWVDPTTHTYYLADRSNASVDLIDIRSATFIGRITGFRGVQPAGPGGQGRQRASEEGGEQRRDRRERARRGLLLSLETRP